MDYVEYKMETGFCENVMQLRVVETEMNDCNEIKLH